MGDERGDLAQPVMFCAGGAKAVPPFSKERAWTPEKWVETNHHAPVNRRGTGRAEAGTRRPGGTRSDRGTAGGPTNPPHGCPQVKPKSLTMVID